MPTKEELQSMGITALKAIAKSLGIPGYSKYLLADKDKLIDLILEKQGATPVQPPPPKPPPAPPKPPAPEPGPLLGARPDPTIVQGGPATKVEDVPVIKKKEFVFNPSEILGDVNVKLEEYKPGKSPEIAEDDTDEITPTMLLEQIKTDEFMTKVVTTLYNLYRMKDKKYSAIEERVKKSIKLDLQEMNEMAAVIDRRDAEKMFPLIPVNQALLVKLKKIRMLCQDMIKQYSKLSPSLISKVRKNFRLGHITSFFRRGGGWG